MNFFKNSILLITTFVLVSAQAENQTTDLKVKKVYDIPKIIEAIKAIPEDKRHEAEKALLNFLDNGIYVKKGYFGDSLKIGNYEPLAENCDAAPEDLMRYVLDNIERNDGSGIVQEVWISQYSQTATERIDLALENLKKNKNADCAPCKQFKDFLEQQKVLIEQRNKEIVIVEFIRVAQKRAALKELLK